MKNRIDSLQRTIRFLCGEMEKAADNVYQNPALAVLILKEAQSDKRYNYR